MKRGNSSKKFPSLIQHSNSHHSQGQKVVASDKKIEVKISNLIFNLFEFAQIPKNMM